MGEEIQGYRDNNETLCNKLKGLQANQNHVNPDREEVFKIADTLKREHKIDLFKGQALSPANIYTACPTRISAFLWFAKFELSFTEALKKAAQTQLRKELKIVH